MKRPARPDLSATEAARLGEELREARLTLGASIEDMAAQLRIHRRYLLALEEGRIRDLPGPAYAVGFMRSYAAALGLDADEVVRRFRDVAGGAAAKPSELVFPTPVPSRGVPAGALVVVGACLAIGAYVAWYHWSGSGDRIVDVVPPVPPRLDAAVEEGQRIREPAESLPAVAAPPADEPPAAPPPRAESAGAGAPRPDPVPAPAQTRMAAPPAVAPRVVLRARGDSWVQIRDSRSNQVIFDRVMRNGDTYEVPDREGLVLTTGKAENLDVMLDGEVTPTLAGATGVRRGIPLDPARLRGEGGAAASRAAGEGPGRP